MRNSIREYFKKNLSSDRLAEIEKNALNGNTGFSYEIAKILHDMLSEDGLGLGILAIPQEYGGLDTGLPAILSVGEELGRHDLGIATGVLATMLAAAPVFNGGTEEQKKRISEIIRKGGIGALSATEASGGSSLSSLGTKAELKDSSYVINGGKQWITNAGIADFYVVLANAPGGPSWFIIDRYTPGISFGQPAQKHGQNLSITAGISFDNVKIPRECLLGGIEGNGLRQASSAFDITRIVVASLALGTGSAAMEDAVRYAKSRNSGSLLNNEAFVKGLILPHFARLEAIRQYFAAISNFVFLPSDNSTSSQNVFGGNFSISAEAALAKFFAAEECLSSCNAAVQACGGAGISRENPFGKRLADCRPLLIYEGADEVLKISLFRHRWQDYLRSGGNLYSDKAALIAGPKESGCDIASKSLVILSYIMGICRKYRLTRDRFITLKLGEIIAWMEISAAFSYMVQNGNLNYSRECEQYLARLFAKEALNRAYSCGLYILSEVSSEAGSEFSGLLISNLEEISALLSGEKEDFKNLVEEITSKAI